MLTKLYNLIKSHPADTLLVIAVILLTITSYNLGKIAAFRSLKTPIAVYEGTNQQNIVRPEAGERVAVPSPTPRDETVVASKKSKSMLYHFSWCSGAKAIADANRLTFSTETAAIAAGYSLAGNCKK